MSYVPVDVPAFGGLDLRDPEDASGSPDLLNVFERRAGVLSTRCGLSSVGSTNLGSEPTGLTAYSTSGLACGFGTTVRTFTTAGVTTASTTGSAPLSVTDLGSISNVRNSTLDQGLEYRDERDLIDLFGDLTATGDARFYYMTSDTTIATYPADTTSTLKVTYYKIPTELSADSDTPLVPSRYHMAIVEYAVAHAYKDNDNPQAAQVARQEGDRLVQLMRERLLVPSHQSTDFISSLGGSVDG